ncbi:MAG: ABC transporter substrate-binding protein [Propionibacteriaceae bacterium]|jgi:ABC-type transport system substrate-binding protein|nr:ABC transporter substrate-binding protein [Propionibacteriaceae bacterium]
MKYTKLAALGLAAALAFAGCSSGNNESPSDNAGGGTPLAGNPGANKAVRQAVAQLIDRDAITQNAYDGIKTPAYSIVPKGFEGEKDSFKDKYGDPNEDAAAKILSDAGIATPVNLTLGYPPEHYGAEAVDEANELAKQLEDSGLFKVNIKSAAWEEYQSLYKEQAYDLYLLGWYPDFLDADNYLSPFIVDGGFFKNGYSSEEVNKLIDEELAETDTATRDGIIGQLQDIVAEDVPLVPSWNGKNTAVARTDVKGVEETLDANYIFRLWEVDKDGKSWTLGTTDTITMIDPAGAYDIGSWNLQYSVFEQLMRQPGADKPAVGDAAESCEYTDSKTIKCILRKGNKFSNGHDLTSSDVKFSFERNLLINEPDGASILLASIADNPGEEGQKLSEGAIETPDDTTVIFHLNKEDTTFLSVLATGPASIVDEEVYAKDKLMTNDADNIGSGSLTIKAFTKGQQGSFAKNDKYSGNRPAQSEQVLVQYFTDASPLRQAIESGEIDVAWRTLSPTDLTSLESVEGVKVYNGEGSEFRYWVFQCAE